MAFTIYDRIPYQTDTVASISDAMDFLKLKIESTNNADKITLALAAAKELLFLLLGYNLTQQLATTITFNGNGETWLEIDKVMSNVTDISIDGTSQTLSNFYLKSPWDFTIYSLNNIVFTDDIQNITITADWGVSNSNWPVPLKQAHLLLTNYLYQQDFETIPYTMQKYDNNEFNIIADIPKPVITLIRDFQNRVL